MVAPNQVQVINRVPMFLANARPARERAVMNATLIWRDAMIQTISGKGRGRVYTHKGYTHQASAPGDPPALETGELAGSIFAQAAGLTAFVGTPLIKGLWMERGTVKQAPRPFIARSFRSSRHLIMTLLASRWDEGVRGGGGGVGMTRGGIRSLLYGGGQLIGDVSSISGGIQGASGLRTGLYQAGRVLGDVGAVSGGSIMQRGFNRGIGGQAQQGVSAMPGRVGRRAVGRGTGMGIRQITG